MYKFSTDTYTLKREILAFSNKIIKNFVRNKRKFMAGMNYGILASDYAMISFIINIYDMSLFYFK